MLTSAVLIPAAAAGSIAALTLKALLSLGTTSASIWLTSLTNAKHAATQALTATITEGVKQTLLLTRIIAEAAEISAQVGGVVSLEVVRSQHV